MPDGICTHDGCDSPCFSRGWCRLHYAQWYRSRCEPCQVDGCAKPGTARGMCPMHYSRWKKHGDPLIRLQGGRPPLDLTQRKRCEQCGATFGPTRGRAHHQWARQRFCDARCSRTWAAQQQQPLLKTQRQWAMAWERHRVREDRCELNAEEERQRRRQRRIDAATKPLPGPRQFTAGICSDCGLHYVVHKRKWNDSPRCSRCTKKHWRANHRKRARRYDVEYIHISAVAIFKRDDWRCQLCGRKTRGIYPDPRSPSLDHIIPMVHGGAHVESNLQCACWQCNVRKGAHAANDQLRLAV